MRFAVHQHVHVRRRQAEARRHNLVAADVRHGLRLVTVGDDALLPKEVLVIRKAVELAGIARVYERRKRIARIARHPVRIQHRIADDGGGVGLDIEIVIARRALQRVVIVIGRTVVEIKRSPSIVQIPHASGRIRHIVHLVGEIVKDGVVNYQCGVGRDAKQAPSKTVKRAMLDLDLVPPVAVNRVDHAHLVLAGNAPIILEERVTEDEQACAAGVLRTFSAHRGETVKHRVRIARIQVVATHHRFAHGKVRGAGIDEPFRHNAVGGRRAQRVVGHVEPPRIDSRPVASIQGWAEVRTGGNRHVSDDIVGNRHILNLRIGATLDVKTKTRGSIPEIDPRNRDLRDLEPVGAGKRENRLSPFRLSVTGKHRARPLAEDLDAAHVRERIGLDGVGALGKMDAVAAAHIVHRRAERVVGRRLRTVAALLRSRIDIDVAHGNEQRFIIRERVAVAVRGRTLRRTQVDVKLRIPLRPL